MSGDRSTFFVDKRGEIGYNGARMMRPARRGKEKETNMRVNERMKKVFSIFLVCILLLSTIYSKTKNELTVFNNLKSTEISINNVKIDDDKSQILINELKNSKRKGILKLLCMFEIEIKTDDKIIKLKSNGGNLFSFLKVFF